MVHARRRKWECRVVDSPDIVDALNSHPRQPYDLVLFVRRPPPAKNQDGVDIATFISHALADVGSKPRGSRIQQSLQKHKTSLECADINRPGWQQAWARYYEQRPFPTPGAYIRRGMLHALAANSGPANMSVVESWITDHGFQTPMTLASEEVEEVA